MRKFSLVPALLAGFVVFYSCSESPFQENEGRYVNGAFVLNEGTYGSSNASVSFIDTKKDTILNEIFYQTNNRPVGDVLQSVYTDDNLVYLVVNNSNKIEVVNKADFTEKATIVGLDQPRYFTIANGKGYVTQWGAGGSVAVVNLSTSQVVKTILSGTGPESLLGINGKLVVANGGGWQLDSTLSVFNIVADTLEKKVTVGYNPKEMATDNENNIWVLCYGYIAYNPDWSVANEFPASLVKVSPATFTVQKVITLGAGLHPQHLDVSADRKTIYVGGGFGFNGIYALSASSVAFPSAPMIDGYFYGFNVDPASGDIYTCTAPDFVNPGIVRIWSKAGSVLFEYNSGIAPNGVIF